MPYWRNSVSSQHAMNSRTGATDKGRGRHKVSPFKVWFCAGSLVPVVLIVLERWETAAPDASRR